MTAEQAEAFARQLFNDKNGKPCTGLRRQDRARLVRSGWTDAAAVAAVRRVEARAGHGRSAAPTRISCRRRPLTRCASATRICTALTVPDEGHAPLLWDAPDDRRHRGVLRPADATPTMPRRRAAVTTLSPFARIDFATVDAAREFGLPAACQDARLLDPVLALDAALEVEHARLTRSISSAVQLAICS